MPQLGFWLRLFLIYLAAVVSVALGQSQNDQAMAAQEAGDKWLIVLTAMANAKHDDPAANEEAIAIRKERFLLATDQSKRETMAPELLKARDAAEGLIASNDFLVERKNAARELGVYGIC